jgi:NAD/NADP transhydrogenase beta subunit
VTYANATGEMKITSGELPVGSVGRILLTLISKTMNRSLSIISEIPANKAGIELFANALVDGLMSGDVDPLEIRAKIDAIEKIIKAVKDNEQFRDVVLGRRRFTQ